LFPHVEDDGHDVLLAGSRGSKPGHRARLPRSIVAIIASPRAMESGADPGSVCSVQQLDVPCAVAYHSRRSI